MVPYIPDVIPRPDLGPLEAIDEIPTQKDYYNGSLKLNKVDVNCKLYPDKNDCMAQDNCGWCGQLSSCILGNPNGPLETCDKVSYIFAAPIPMGPFGQRPEYPQLINKQ